MAKHDHKDDKSAFDHGHLFGYILTNRGQFLYYFHHKFQVLFVIDLQADIVKVTLVLRYLSVAFFELNQGTHMLVFFFIRGMNHNLSPLNNRCDVLHTAPILLGKCTRILPTGQRCRIKTVPNFSV